MCIELAVALRIFFYGIAFVLFGYLMFRSGYLPGVLGILLALGGLGFVSTSLALFLAPAYAFSFLLLPTVLAGLLLTLWLLVKGVDVHKWEAKAAGAVHQNQLP